MSWDEPNIEELEGMNYGWIDFEADGTRGMKSYEAETCSMNSKIIKVQRINKEAV